MHTFDSETSLIDTFDINGLIITCPVELAIASRSSVEYSSKEKT
jgi:hypothetical protein